MFRRSHNQTESQSPLSLGVPEKAAFAQVLESLGMTVIRWKDQTATVRRDEGKIDLDVSLLVSQLPVGADLTDPRSLTLLVGPMLGMPLPQNLLDNLDEAGEWLRPRLINPAELSGPRRNMCRRDAFAGLLRAISIGPGSTASLVRTEELDRWGIEFDRAFAIACDNLRRSILPDDIHEVDQSFGTLAIIHDSEPAAAACFIFDTLLPHWQPESGAVFAIPTEDTCLVLPVMHGMGAEALADFVQMSFNLFGRTEDALCDQLIWAKGEERNGMLDPRPRYHHLPITKVEERGGKRVHLEAVGAMGELLRVLGTLDD
ncbi:MAG: hypothetical protein ACF8MJ_06750 [Phycisphaerales bacterium JB050]